MNPVTVDIKDMLEDESGLGLVFATNLFIGREPTTPDNCVTLYDPPGGRVGLTLDAKRERYLYNDLQVRVRNNSYVTGWEVAEEIMDYLHGWANEEYNGTYYAFIQCITPPELLEWDENNRAVFIVNFQIQRR